MTIAILILFGLLTKHLIVDFMMQTPQMLAEKGDFRRRGGYEHAVEHAIGTALVFLAFGFTTWWCLIDGVVHYLVDWLKVNISRRYGWKPSQPQFWWALGLDQYAHALTYLGIVYLALMLRW